MRFGFIKCGAASPSLKVADCDYNVSEIINNIKSKKTNEETKDYLMQNLNENQSKKLKEVLSVLFFLSFL